MDVQNDIPNVRYRWQRPYLAAALETDTRQLPDKISEARHAIRGRKFDGVPLDDLGDAGAIQDIELLNFGALADVRLKKVRLAAILVVGQHDVLTRIEEAARGVQADEAHATDQQRWSSHYRSRVLGAKISSICMTRGVRPCS